MSPSAGADPGRPRATRRPVFAPLFCASLLLGACGLLSLGAWAQDAGPTARPPVTTPPVGIPPVVDPPGNPTTAAKVALGKRLFADPRLSVDSTISCASCHVATLAFTDGRRLAVGVEGKVGNRNAPTLLNAALHKHLFWDGRAPTLEEQARKPFMNLLEMGWEDESALHERVRGLTEYADAFEEVFGTRDVTLQHVVRAIAAFERTLIAGDSRFDRWWAHGVHPDALPPGERQEYEDLAARAGLSFLLTPEQRRGYDLFVDEGGCAQCHPIRQSFATFTDDDFHNTGAGAKDVGPNQGRDDIGRMAVTGREEDRGKFRTPSLRNVELTAPYMHDGSLATLEDVVDFYVEGGADNTNLSHLMRPLEIDEQGREDLVAFLKALTSFSLPQLEECERLLLEGRPQDAFDAFSAELRRLPGDARALSGMARAALVLDDPNALLPTEIALREAIKAATAAGTESAGSADAPAELLLHLGDVNAALATFDESMGLARQEDALVAWARIRRSVADPDDPIRRQAAVREARLLEALDRADEGLAVLTELLATVRGDDEVAEARAGLLYRRGWAGFQGGSPTDAARADLRAAADAFDIAKARGRALSPTSLLYRAYARHWGGESEAARAAYLDAVTVPDIAVRALQGLRNLLARDLATYRSAIHRLAALHPRAEALQYFAGYELLQEGRLDEARAKLESLLDSEDWPAAGVHHHLAQVARKAGDRATAVDHYAVALALDPNLRGLITEFEQYVLGHPLNGFDDVYEMLAEHDRLLTAGPDDLRFQIFVRNNMAFVLREVASSYTSRGPARVQTLVEGAPPDTLAIARRSLALYEQASALIPEDARDRPFAERWGYAGVLNDTGLMLHYFTPLQDLGRAEAYYLRAFDLTQGAYMDAYFYNLQFLYGFELTGKEDQWLTLARVAKDAILREDPESPTGFSPDEFKRQAARRDFERLTTRE